MPIEGRALSLLKDGRNYAHVAIPTDDGSVQTVIVWAHADGAGNVTLNSAEGRLWPENLRKIRRCTVTLMSADNPAEYVSIKARLVDDSLEGADEDIDRLAMKYLGEPHYPFRQPGERRIRFTLEPEEVIHHVG